MMISPVRTFTLVLLVAIGGAAFWWFWPEFRPVPEVVRFDAPPVSSIFQKERLQEGEVSSVAQADALLNSPLITVIDKEFLPPSGDARDYMSISIYWWPNEKSANGLPWVHRDGEKNPIVEKYDSPKLRRVAKVTRTLALAWKGTGDEKYAAKASQLLRTFFLDSETGMNPNLNFAQGIPGKKPGNRQGVIEGLPVSREVLDTVMMLRSSTSWSNEDDSGFTEWALEFRNWLVNSSLGKSESRRRNNHGIWYDVQLVSLGLFLEEDDSIADYLAETSTRRILMQIGSDGKMRRELGRTKSWDYSVYNLDALTRLAGLAEKVGVDLWNYPSAEDRRIVKAFSFLETYSSRKNDWPWQQIKPFHPAASLARFRPVIPTPYVAASR